MLSLQSIFIQNKLKYFKNRNAVKIRPLKKFASFISRNKYGKLYYLFGGNISSILEDIGAH